MNYRADATLVADEEDLKKEVQMFEAEKEECIKAGKTVCCYTTRSLIKVITGNKEDELLVYPLRFQMQYSHWLED